MGLLRRVCRLSLACGSERRVSRRQTIPELHARITRQSILLSRVIMAIARAAARETIAEIRSASLVTNSKWPARSLLAPGVTLI